MTATTPPNGSSIAGAGGSASDGSPGSTSLYDQLGGEAQLRAIIETFVDRMMNDMMIGFFFRKVNRARLLEMEFQHAAEWMGGPFKYTGRPLDQAHRAHRIMGGQFARRKHILRGVLREFGAPPQVEQAWMRHIETLRPLITQDPGSACR